MDNKWHALNQNTVFLSPNLTGKFYNHFGDLVVMPFAFRGTPKHFDVEHTNGSPVFYNNKYFALWSMRPARNVASVAIGLKPMDLEKNANRQLICEDNIIANNKWRVHHVYECGLSHLNVQERSFLFTNLSNLVFMKKELHSKYKKFVHGDGDGARWLKWVVGEIYPKAKRICVSPALRPSGSPDINQIQICVENDNAFNGLKKLREKEPAGSKNVSIKINKLNLQNFSHQSTRFLPPKPEIYLKPKVIIKDLKKLGYLARQNKKGEPYYLNLGGPRSEMNKKNFHGLILLNPSKGIFFGVCQKDAYYLRDLTMKKTTDDEWIRKQDAPGPSTDNRVEVTLLYSENNNSKMKCKIKNGKPIWITGIAKKIVFFKKTCLWDDIQFFLNELES
ncbi:hypothetical protein [Desulfobacula sp.]|jgi:hypothetical protein|uniref:hypothetical protein n=1 Tax=Desulfobacula sp. TaxID=2593537 RepID=UPI001DA5EA86|nr:hypothetical protein [Candidatus Neomarinimicrobiota bacterium]MBT4508894.1 hypothetical protein [Desulfobacula sp.]MBT4877137.1 hypothetical protein [Desulfobacula sp.]